MINIILCTDKMDLVAAFYAAIGIELNAEKHGNGPDHFSFASEISCEIYPPRIPSDANMVLRIDTDDLEKTMLTLKEQFNYSGLVVSDIQHLRSGQKSIVRDPDGRILELFEPRNL